LFWFIKGYAHSYRDKYILITFSDCNSKTLFLENLKTTEKIRYRLGEHICKRQI
jgi:hypothetical protein